MTTLPLSRTLITLAISQMLLACAPLKPQFVSHFSTDPNQPPGSTAPMASSPDSATAQKTDDNDNVRTIIGTGG